MEKRFVGRGGEGEGEGGERENIVHEMIKNPVNYFGERKEVSAFSDGGRGKEGEREGEGEGGERERKREIIIFFSIIFNVYFFFFELIVDT